MVFMKLFHFNSQSKSLNYELFYQKNKTEQTWKETKLKLHVFIVVNHSNNSDDNGPV